MPSAWRLTKTKFAGFPLSADGARLYGGRWNSPGVSVVYFAESISLAVLEVLVHLEAVSLLDSYSLVRIDFDASVARSLTQDDLPSAWADYPAPAELQAIGNAWVDSSASLVLRVPSAVISHETILLLNPDHPSRVDLVVADPVPFHLDPRLLQ